MDDLRLLRKRLMIVLIALIAIDLASLAVLVSPAGHSREQEIRDLEAQLKIKTRQVEPLRGLDQKVVVAKDEIADFYTNRLPVAYSAIDDELGKLAIQNGTKIAQAKYHNEDVVGGGLRPVTIDALLSGDYLHVMRFINALERDRQFFIVDGVVLGDAQGGTVKLQLKMQTYMRTGA